MLLELQGVTAQGSQLSTMTRMTTLGRPRLAEGPTLSHAEAWYEGMLLVPWQVAALLFSGPHGVHVTFHHEVRQQRLVEELYFVVRLPGQRQTVHRALVGRAPEAAEESEEDESEEDAASLVSVHSSMSSLLRLRGRRASSQGGGGS
jgi:hypothetical protein